MSKIFLIFAENFRTMKKLNWRDKIDLWLINHDLTGADIGFAITAIGLAIFVTFFML